MVFVKSAVNRCQPVSSWYFNKVDFFLLFGFTAFEIGNQT